MARPFGLTSVSESLILCSLLLGMLFIPALVSTTTALDDGSASVSADAARFLLDYTYN